VGGVGSKIYIKKIKSICNEGIYIYIQKCYRHTGGIHIVECSEFSRTDFIKISKNMGKNCIGQWIELLPD
jgi:hypothetical protein